MTLSEIKEILKSYLSKQVFSGHLPKDFNDDTPLISSRLVNSITVLHLVNHVEEIFKLEFEAHEVNVDNLDTINLFGEFLEKKINARK